MNAKQKSYLPRKTAIREVIKFLVELPNHNISDKENKNYDKIILETIRMLDRELSGFLAHPQSPYTHEYNNFIGQAFPGGLERTDKGKDFLLYLNKEIILIENTILNKDSIPKLEIDINGKKKLIPRQNELKNPEKGIAGVIGNYLAISIFTQRGIILEKLAEKNPEWQVDLEANENALEVLKALPATAEKIQRDNFVPMLSEIGHDLQENIRATNRALEVLENVATAMSVEDQNSRINIEDNQRTLEIVDTSPENQDKINESSKALETLATWAKYRDFLKDTEANEDALKILETPTIPVERKTFEEFLKVLVETNEKFKIILKDHKKALEILKTVTMSVEVINQAEITSFTARLDSEREQRSNNNMPPNNQEQTYFNYICSLGLFFKENICAFFSLPASANVPNNGQQIQTQTDSNEEQKFVKLVRLSQIDRGLGGNYIDRSYNPKFYNITH